MKNYFLLPILFLSIVSCSLNIEKAKDTTKSTVAQKMTPKNQLRHVVLFKFKETASPEEIEIVEEAFAGLEDKIPQVRAFEWGTNNSPEGLNKDFTHSFFVTFNSEADREVYLPHPAHQAFVALLTPILDDVLVIDYWTGGK